MKKCGRESWTDLPSASGPFLDRWHLDVPEYGQLTPELAARGKPGLPDMLIALFSGVAASYCIARPNLASALAGVAIAAALVPPIATTGISLAWGNYMNATGSALLFGINVLAIILGAALSFYGAGIRGNTHFSGRQLWTSRLLQQVLYGLLTDPAAGAAIAAAETTYLDRRRALVDALRAAGVGVESGRSGLNLWVPVDDERDAVVSLAASGIGAAPGSPFSVDADERHHIRLTISTVVDPEPLAAAVAAAASRGSGVAGR